MHRELAKITDTFLGIEDHGIFTCVLYVKYGGATHQGIGGYTFDNYDETKKRRLGSAFASDFILRVLEVCGVDRWEKLKGRTIWVLKESDKWGAKVLGIQSLETEGTAIFLFDDLVKEHFGEIK